MTASWHRNSVGFGSRIADRGSVAVPRRAGTVVRLPGAAGGRCRRRCIWPGLVRRVDDRGSASGRGTHGETRSCSGVCRVVSWCSPPRPVLRHRTRTVRGSRGTDHQRTAIKMTSGGNLIPANAALGGSTGRTKCRRFTPNSFACERSWQARCCERARSCPMQNRPTINASSTSLRFGGCFKVVVELVNLWM
jgi:hypothetical protein